MAIIRTTVYPNRYDAPTSGQPQGAFRNKSTPTSQDGSYLEAQWINDFSAYFSSMMEAANISYNGTVDAVGACQYFDALEFLIDSAVTTHVNNKNNPHNVTKSQIGLGNVQNYGISDSVALNSSTSYASSKAVKAAYDLAATKITTATADGRYLQLSDVNSGGDWADVVNKVPRIRGDGVLSAARFIDFHTNNSTAAFDMRLDCSNANTLNVFGGNLVVPDSGSYLAAQSYKLYGSTGTVFRRSGGDLVVGSNSDNQLTANFVMETKDNQNLYHRTPSATHRVITSQSITRSANQTGYLMIYGTIIQWQYVPYAPADVNDWKLFTFPIPFPNRVLNLQATFTTNDAGAGTANIAVAFNSTQLAQKTGCGLVCSRSGNILVMSVGF